MCQILQLILTPHGGSTLPGHAGIHTWHANYIKMTGVFGNIPLQRRSFLEIVVSPVMAFVLQLVCHGSKLLFLILCCLWFVYVTLPYPTLPYPTLPYPTLPYPTLPYPTLPYPTLPYPTLPYPTLPYPTLPDRRGDCTCSN